MSCNPDSGFQLENVYEAMLWYKWVYWNKGIPAKEFNKELSVDIKDIMAINSAISEKNLRQAKLNKLLSKVGVR